MAETKRQMRERLHERTTQLQEEHEALQRSGKLFDQNEHDRHREALHRHQQDLALYRDMPDDPPD